MLLCSAERVQVEVCCLVVCVAALVDPVPVHLLPVTLLLHFVAAAAAEIRRAQIQQQANAAAAAAAAGMQAKHEETTRVTGEFKAGVENKNSSSK